MAATKTRNNKVESEIERFRSSQLWEKALDLTKTQFSKTASGLDVMVNLLQGEKELETYLRDNPPNEENADKARKELTNSEKCLRFVIQNSLKEREHFKQEAVLMLGKLLFAQAKFSEALREFDNINLDRITLIHITNRMLKILAEGLAVKAMCMEKILQQGTMADNMNINNDQIIKYYEQASDFMLLFLQNSDAGDLSSQTSYTGQMTLGSGGDLYDFSIGSILETAVQKSPIAYLEKGQVENSIGRFRQLLRAVGAANSKNLYRLTLARQLAEVLLRGVCSSTYPRVKIASDTKQNKGEFKPKFYDSPNMFVPNNEEEEAILLLLIAEAMANKEAILERRPEHIQSRNHAYDNATAIYDLLAVALVRRANCTLLSEALERAMKFSYEEHHVWYQFALSLIETGKFDRAYLVLKECHRLKPNDPTILLLQARLCYDKLHQADDGIAVCKKAIEISDNSITKSKAFLMLAVGYSHKAFDCRTRTEREELQKIAFDAYTEAYKQDKHNLEAVFFLGLHLAQQRKLSEALTYTKMVLKMQPDHMSGLTLLSLILSAEKKYDKALQVINIALGEHPDSQSLLLVKSKLESSLGSFTDSLKTCAQMLKLWKQDYNTVVEMEEKRGTGLLERFTSSDNKDLLFITDVSHDTGGSVRESLAASRVEKALSEVGSSSPSSLWVKNKPQHSWMLQNQIWLHMAEIYLEYDRFEEAHRCVHEAMAVYPLSYLSSCMKGRILLAEKNYSDAKSHFEAALSVNPYHVKSMADLGKCVFMLGNSQLAEKTLRDAVSTDPTSHYAWRELGIVLESANEFDTAADCLMTSINLECSSPIVPFGILQRAL